MKILLGHDRAGGQKVYVPKSSFKTHWHLIGGTGKGKTTAVHTMLHPLLIDPIDADCWFIIDRLGGLSHDLLLWMASEYCTDDVRSRLVYIEPAREDVVIGFNPLLYRTPAEGYYKVTRSTDTILRGWSAQNLAEMPRLARWLFNSMWACAQLGLTVSDAAHLLMPGSPFHTALLTALPPMLKAEWQEIHRSHGAEASRILESTRNRLKPYFESDILRRMFGSTRNHLDVHRMMREGKIVLINLASRNRLSPQEADAIGGMVINEVLATARGLRPEERSPTFLLLDEFQRFVGPDLVEALPEVRQLELRLILAHQSFSQLVRGDIDLTSMIFQAQSRMIFGLQGEDADTVARELASLTFDPKRIKDELYVSRQRQKGHRVVELASWGASDAAAENWSKEWGSGWSSQDSRARREGTFGKDVLSGASGKSGSEAEKKGGGTTQTTTRGSHEQLVPVVEDFEELATRSYYSFDEMMQVWARDVRHRRTGECYLRLVDDPAVYDVRVKRSAPGHLSWDAKTLREELPEILEDVELLLEQNFASDFFTSPQQIDREAQTRLESVLRPPAQLTTQPSKTSVPTPGGVATAENDTFL